MTYESYFFRTFIIKCVRCTNRYQLLFYHIADIEASDILLQQAGEPFEVRSKEQFRVYLTLSYTVDNFTVLTTLAPMALSLQVHT